MTESRRVVVDRISDTLEELEDSPYGLIDDSSGVVADSIQEVDNQVRTSIDNVLHVVGNALNELGYRVSTLRTELIGMVIKLSQQRTNQREDGLYHQWRVGNNCIQQRPDQLSHSNTDLWGLVAKCDNERRDGQCQLDRKVRQDLGETLEPIDQNHECRRTGGSTDTQYCRESR